MAVKQELFLYNLLHSPVKTLQSVRRSHRFKAGQSSSNKLLKFTPAATLVAVFSFVAVSAHSQLPQNSEADKASTSTSPQHSVVPDPIAPAAASDDPDVAAPPSGQASELKTSIESNNGKVKVKVNDQSVPVPENGTQTRVIESPDGTQSTITIRSHSNSSSTDVDTRSRVRTNSSSSFSSNGDITITRESQ